MPSVRDAEAALSISPPSSIFHYMLKFPTISLPKGFFCVFVQISKCWRINATRSNFWLIMSGSWNINTLVFLCHRWGNSEAYSTLFWGIFSSFSFGHPQSVLSIKTLSIGFLCHITSSHLMLLGSTQINRKRQKQELALNSRGGSDFFWLGFVCILSVSFFSLPCLNWHCCLGTHMYDILYIIAVTMRPAFFGKGG